MNQVDLARFQQEEMLRYYEVTDDADAIADMLTKLSIYYKEPDLDMFLDMPSSRLALLVKEIDKHYKEAKHRGGM